MILFSTKKVKDIIIFLNYRNNVIETKMAISVRQIIEVNLEGGVVVDRFPNEELKIAFFVTELEIDKSMYREIAETMLKWALDHHCRLIISAAGVTIDDEKRIDSIEDEINLFAISSIKSGQATIKKYGFPLLKSGTFSGIPAILLNEANLLNFEVIVLVVRVIKELPDFRAAAIISDAITKIVPGVHCDIGTLMGEAKIIEENIKKIRENQRVTLRGGIYT